MADVNIDADMQTEDNLGTMSHHPIRTAGAAFLIGMGAGMMTNMIRHESKSPMQRLMDQLGL